MCSNSKLWTFWSHSHPNDVQVIFCDRNASVKHFFATQSQFRDPEIVVQNHKNLRKVILRDRIEIYWSWFIDFEPNFMVINSQLYKIINIDNGLYKLSIACSNKLHTLVCGYIRRPDMNLEMGSCPSSRTVRVCHTLSTAIIYGLVKLYDPYQSSFRLTVHCQIHIFMHLCHEIRKTVSRDSHWNFKADFMVQKKFFG